VLGAAAGLLAAVPKSFRAGTLAVVFAFAALGVALAGPQAQGGYTRDVDRGDLRARFETLSEDRLSRRADIWEALADDASEGATWVYVGVGLGDLDHYLGALCPTLAQRGRDGRSTLHSHNTLLEVWLGLGLPGLLCLAWCILSLARRLRWGSPEAGLGVAMLVISSGNVTLFDLTGGCQTFGVLLALGARTDAGRQGRGVR
jgi:O-antigen ligase